MKSKQWLLVLLIAVLVPLLSMIPTWNGYVAERPPEKIFMGFRFMADDHFQYAGFISQSADEGKLFTENPFTTEPQKGRFVLLYMWMVGQIARLTGWGISWSWEFSRLFVGVAFMLVAWWFSGLLFKDARSRFLGYVFVAFSGGIGWALYLMLVGQSQKGLQGSSLNDPFNYQWNWSTFGTMVLPLWVAPAALLLIGACLVAGNYRRSIRLVLGFVLPPLIYFMHPYTGIAAYATFSLFPLLPMFGALWRREAIPWESFFEKLKTVLPMLASFVIVACYLLWARQDQVYAINAQRAFSWNPSYSPFLYPFAYGLLLPLTIYGIWWSGSLRTKARDMLVAWLIASTILSLNPFLAGVKFQYLIHLPLAFFSAHGLIELKQRSESFRKLLSGVGALVLGVLLFLNSALIIFKDMPPIASDTNIYLSASELAAMKFLKEQSPGNVLSSGWIGNRIPWLAGKKVYVGHWFLTIDYDRKLAEVASFFKPELSAEQKRAWLAQKEIKYVYHGGVEKSVGPVDPALGLAKIYDQDGVAIYVVP